IDFIVKFTYVQSIPIHSTRGVLMRRLASGERERHLRAKGDATFVPGPYSGSLAGHYEPARSDHGQRHKGQDAALARRKARGVTLHAQGPANRARPGATHSRTDPGQPGSCALWRADPSVSREREEENEGDPLAQSRKQGPIFFCCLTTEE